MSASPYRKTYLEKFTLDKTIRLLVADDHAIVRDGLAALVQDEPGMMVVGRAGDGHEALTLVREHRPDVALLDITMPDMDGLTATRLIAEKFPDVKVLILTMHEEEAFFFEALRAGASGYVLKGVQGEELMNAIRAVHEDGVYLSARLAGELVDDYLERRPQSPQDDPLTPREREVLALIARGFTNREVAEQLTLTINTVKTHRSHIYQKLELHDRVGLIDYALRHGLLAS